jgi:hypothetical protein
LVGAKRDLPEVERILNDHGFKVTVIRDATHSDFDKPINDFKSKIDPTNPSRFLFYFNGHGYTLKTGDVEFGYIVPSDAPLPTEDRGFTAKAISMNKIERIAREISPSHALFLYDSYFSGSLFTTMRGVPNSLMERAELPVRLFITAGSAGQSVPDNSIFLQAFVKGLEDEAAQSWENTLRTM